MRTGVSAGRRIVFWRHGRTQWNAQQLFQGQTDIPLDEVGHQQAREAAMHLQHLAPHVIVASDLQRASSTAAYLAELTGMTVQPDPRLRETHAGEWEGLDRPTLLDRFGDQVALWSADSTVRPGGGETRLEVAKRMVEAIQDALESVPESGTLVVVTHGGAARAAIGELLELPHANWACLGVLANCAWSVLVANTMGHGPAWRLQEYNAGSLPQPALADDR